MKPIPAFIWIFLIGALLFMASAPALYSLIRETAVQEQAYRRYELTPRYEYDAVQMQPQPGVGPKLEVRFGKALVVITDGHGELGGRQLDQLTPAERDLRAEDKVTLTVNGQDYSTPAQAVIRPAFHDANRYHGYLHVVELTDRESGTTRLAVIQRTGGIVSGPPFEPFLSWRLLLIDEAGTVSEEIFSYAERSRPVYRAMLANFASPVQVWIGSGGPERDTSAAYPYLAPIGTGAAGLILLVLGIRGYLRHRKSL